MNPFRLLKNLFVDLLLKFTGTYVGAPAHEHEKDDLAPSELEATES